MTEEDEETKKLAEGLASLGVNNAAEVAEMARVLREEAIAKHLADLLGQLLAEYDEEGGEETT